MRFDGRVSRRRHRHRQAAGRRAARHPASSHRRRRRHRDVLGGRVRARRGARRSAASSGAAALPILVGGTGFYYRALVRGLFPGPARDDRLRARLDAVADRRGVESLHRWLTRVDAESARRIQPRDRKRLVRALEVYLLTGRPLTDHFGETTSPIAGMRVLAIGVSMPRPALRERVAARVDAQFARGVVAEVRGLMAAGVPASAHAFSGLVYRQVVEMLRGVRDEAATRELIVRENMRYARRQLIWFRKEPNVRWLEGPGESPAALASARDLVAAFLQSADVRLIASFSSSWIRSASGSCPTRPRTAIRGATRSATSRASCGCACRRCGRWGWRGWRTSGRRRRRRAARPAAWRRHRPARIRSRVTGRWPASCSTGRFRRFRTDFRPI